MTEDKFWDDFAEKHPQLRAIVPAKPTKHPSGPPFTPPPEGLATGTGGDHSPGMEGRVARLEGQMEGHKFVNGVTLVLAGLVISISLAGFAYTFARLDQIGAQVAALPDQIKTDLRELNRAFGDAVTATRNAQPGAPQVIIVPQQPASPP